MSTIPLSFYLIEKKIYFYCDKCGKKFKQNCLLKRHLERKNSCVKEKTCKYCKVEFEYPFVLKKHYANLEKNCIKYKILLENDCLDTLEDLQKEQKEKKMAESHKDKKTILLKESNVENSHNQIDNSVTTDNSINSINSVNNTVNIEININGDSNKTDFRKLTSNPDFNKILSIIHPNNFFPMPTNQITEKSTSKLIKNIEDNTEIKSMTQEFIGNLVFETYIKDVPFQKRAIWCTDVIRNRYLIYIDDDWAVDGKGKMVVEMTTQKIVEKLIEIFTDRTIDINQAIVENYDKNEYDEIVLPELGFPITCLDQLNVYKTKLLDLVNDLKKSKGKPKYLTKPLDNLKGHLVYSKQNLPDNFQIKCLEKYIGKDKHNIITNSPKVECIE